MAQRERKVLYTSTSKKTEGVRQRRREKRIGGGSAASKLKRETKLPWQRGERRSEQED